MPIIQKVVTMWHPELHAKYKDLKIEGIVVGINHPDCAFWVRVTAVKSRNAGCDVGSVVRRIFTVIPQ